MEPFRLDDDGPTGMEQVEQEVEQVREDVFGYYGDQAMRAASPEIAKISPPTPKPEALVLLETLLVTGSLPRRGGYFDQPWLLMQLLEAAGAARAMYQEAEYRNTAPRQ